MPNATARANARTLPEGTTRRAALGAIIAAGAVGATLALPAVAATSDAPRHPDAELFALIDEARAAGARVEAAISALEEAQDRTEEVPWPQALIVTEDDTRLWKLKAGDRFDLVHLGVMRERQAHRVNLRGSISRLSPGALAALTPCVATMDDKDRAAIARMNAEDVRADQLIAALDNRRKALEVARDRSGETAADERVEQRMDEKYDAYTRVANTRATTLSGVLAKLALIAPDVNESTLEFSAEVGTSEPILFSVAVDFKALKAGEART
jgi:hypothetical protein